MFVYVLSVFETDTTREMRETENKKRGDMLVDKEN